MWNSEKVIYYGRIINANYHQRQKVFIPKSQYATGGRGQNNKLRQEAVQ